MRIAQERGYDLGFAAGALCAPLLQADLLGAALAVWVCGALVVFAVDLHRRDS